MFTKHNHTHSYQNQQNSNQGIQCEKLIEYKNTDHNCCQWLHRS